MPGRPAKSEIRFVGPTPERPQLAIGGRTAESYPRDWPAPYTHAPYGHAPRSTRRERGGSAGGSDKTGRAGGGRGGSAGGASGGVGEDEGDEGEVAAVVEGREQLRVHLTRRVRHRAAAKVPTRAARPPRPFTDDPIC